MTRRHAAMNEYAATASGRARRVAVAIHSRWALGVVFVYMGLNKALHPADFLKVLREYDVLDGSLLLNFTAATLPWFELLCGVLLVAGIAVRGAATVLIGMLVPFTAAVLHRALAIHAAKEIAFCAIRFNCGCGSGEVNICHKLLENSLLVFMSVIVLTIRANRWSYRYDLLKSGRAI